MLSFGYFSILLVYFIRFCLNFLFHFKQGKICRSPELYSSLSAILVAVGEHAQYAGWGGGGLRLHCGQLPASLPQGQQEDQAGCHLKVRLKKTFLLRPKTRSLNFETN